MVRKAIEKAVGKAVGKAIKLGAPLLIAVLSAMGPRADAADADPAKVFPNPRTMEVARAVAQGRGAQVEALVRAGADLADRGQGDLTLLQWAMLRGEARMLGLLLDLGADPLQPGYGGGTALHMAAQARKKPYLKILLDHGADPNARDGRTGAPVLSEAVMSRNHDAVKLLLQRRADPNATSQQNETPLHAAALISDYESMLLLLEAGADPSIRNTAGHTFAPYFAIHPKESMMSREARSARAAVQAWLGSHGY